MYSIRAYLDQDFEALTELWHHVNRASYPYVAVHQAYTLEEARAYFRERVLGECRVWLAVDGDGPLGLIAVKEDWIDQLCVAPVAQRQGIGAALLARIREVSPIGLRLFTFQKNLAARSFYEKHGFRPVRFGVSPPPENEPDVEYHWAAGE